MLVYCGAGNNAGDGYVLARLATRGGARRCAWSRSRRRNACAAMRARAEDCEAGAAGDRTVRRRGSGLLARSRPMSIVDALLGIGADRPLDGDFAAAVAAINARQVPVLSLDVPSGLHADTGLPLGNAVRAAVTHDVRRPEAGLVSRRGCDYAATHRVRRPRRCRRAAREGSAPPLARLGVEDIERALPPRPRSAHKGAGGRLLLRRRRPGNGGRDPARGGRLRCARAPDSSTSRRIRESVAAVLAGRPEVIAAPSTLRRISTGLARIWRTRPCVGPGLGKSEWARPLWQRLLGSELPLVVDADGLNLLAEAPRVARALGVDASSRRGRATARRRRPMTFSATGSAPPATLARRYDAVAVLKGAAHAGRAADAAPLAVCDRGNPGMATAGMGDVLAGVLGALVVQTRDLSASARAGVLLHALAGDSAAADGERGTRRGGL